MPAIYHDLKTVMLTKRVSQKDLAELLGISQQALGSKMNGTSDFWVKEATIIANYLEIKDPAVYFLGRKPLV